MEDSYEEGGFDEGAAQVQRLLFRDRKELTGIEDIGQGFQTEFDDEGSEQKVRQPKASSAKQENGAKEASPKPSSFTSGEVPQGLTFSRTGAELFAPAESQKLHSQGCFLLQHWNSSLSQAFPMVLIYNSSRP